MARGSLTAIQPLSEEEARACHEAMDRVVAEERAWWAEFYGEAFPSWPLESGAAIQRAKKHARRVIRREVRKLEAEESEA